MEENARGARGTYMHALLSGEVDPGKYTMQTLHYEMW